MSKIGRRIFVHINNTNPVLDENSPEHAAVGRAGWEVAYDGMEMEIVSDFHDAAQRRLVGERNWKPCCGRWVPSAITTAIRSITG